MLKILYIIIALLILCFITSVHEFGHYLAGRICGIGIREYSIGFGPKIFSFVRKDIRYSLRWIPLGGYCSFIGEDSDSNVPNAMNNMPVWKRFITVLSGPVMNFILAFVFCTVLLTSFVTAEYLPRISQITEGGPAQMCGLELGDVITRVGENDIAYSTEGVVTASSLIAGGAAGEEIYIQVMRDDQLLDISVLPEVVTDEDSGTQRNVIGVSFGGRTFHLGEAVRYACRYMVLITKELLNALKNLIFHGEGVDDMMGPVGIISFVSDLVYDEKMYAAVNITFLLSLNIGIMNLLPLPALDGGRLIFLIVEAIRGKPVPPEKEGVVHLIGFALLIVLIGFITYKDILRVIAGG